MCWINDILCDTLTKKLQRIKIFTLVARAFCALNSPCRPTNSQKLQELCSFLAFWCPPLYELNSLVDAFVLPCNQKLALPMQNHFSSSRSPCGYWIPLRRIIFAPGTVHTNPWTSSILKSPSCPRHVLTSLWADLPATVPPIVVQIYFYKEQPPAMAM